MTSTSRAEPVRRAGVRALGSGALAALFWVAVWQGAALAVGRDFLLASPWQVATRLVELLPTADFWATVWFSLARIALGFCAAAVGGALLAWAAWASRWARALIAPAIAAVRAAPVVSFIILLLLWTDSSRLPAFTSFLMVLPVMYANLGQGLAQRDRSLLEVAWVFDVPLGRRLLAMDIPGVLPYLAAATRITSYNVCYTKLLRAGDRRRQHGHRLRAHGPAQGRRVGAPRLPPHARGDARPA